MTVFAIYPQSIRHPKASNQISLLPPGDLKTECPGLPVCSEGMKVFGEPVFDAAQTPCKHHHHHLYMHIYLPYFKRGNSAAEKPFDFFFAKFIQQGENTYELMSCVPRSAFIVNVFGFSSCKIRANK